MADLVEFHLGNFEPHVDDVFTITLSDENQQPIDVELLLRAVEAMGVKERDIVAHGRESFSLIFEHERKDFYLNQGIYRLEHPVLGQLELFLVPLGPVESGMQYEVIFT